MGLQISDVSLNTLPRMLFDATAYLALMFKISFSTSLKFTALHSKRSLKLNLLVTATLIGWFSYFQ